MDFLELAKKRCTTRGFTDKQIDKDDLDRIIFLRFKKHIKPLVLNVFLLYARTKGML